jgi:hypothetical protein
MTGGDRMLHHGYAEIYERYLRPFRARKTLTLAEFWILSGTGLAIWCDLFPEASILGFDIDLQHYHKSQPYLCSRGAFASNRPELYKFDQLLDKSDNLTNFLAGRRLDIVIDDGFHTAQAIVNTWRSTKPFLASDFAYFIEDFQGLFEESGSEFDTFDCRSFGLMNVIRPRIADAHH